MAGALQQRTYWLTRVCVTFDQCQIDSMEYEIKYHFPVRTDPRYICLSMPVLWFCSDICYLAGAEPEKGSDRNYLQSVHTGK